MRESRKTTPEKAAPSRHKSADTVDDYGAQSKREISRKLILDATEKLMLEEGYGAVSTRRVAKEAGLKAPLVHYYFPTTDDLYIALLDRSVNRRLYEPDGTGEAPPTLTRVWESYRDVQSTGLVVEFMALANHREAVREAFSRYLEKARNKRAEQFASILDEAPGSPEQPGPEALATVLIAVSRTLVMEERLGVSAGHRETLDFIQQWLDALQGGDS